MSGIPSRKRQLEDENHNDELSLSIDLINNNDYNNDGIKESEVEFITNQDNSSINSDDDNKGYDSSRSVEDTTIDSNSVNNNITTIIGVNQISEESNNYSSSNGQYSDEAEEHHDDNYIMNHNDDNNNGDIIETRDGDCQLQHAMRNGESINTILELLELYPMDVQHKNLLGDYPLHTALSCSAEDNSNQYDIVIMKLIELVPQAIQYANVESLYPLHLALMHCISDDVVMKLIDTYPNAVRISVNDWHPLHYACRYDTSQMVLKKLIEMYPEAISQKSDEGRYPIHYATCTDKPNGIIQLLSDGDILGINRRAIGEFNDDYTPLHLACENGCINKVQYFIEHCKNDLLINVKDISGQTALHIACNDLLYQMVSILLNHIDININALDDINETPLHKTLSYSYGDPEVRINVLKRLLNHECIDINIKNNDNKTPLDIIRGRLQTLQNGFLENNGNMTGLEEIELKCVKQMIHMLEEYPIKKRWNAYCYHMIQFQE